MKLPTSVGSSRKQENSRKTSISALLTTPKSLMVWSVTQSQTFWSVKSSGPLEALLLIKLVDAMEFQQSYSKP